MRRLGWTLAGLLWASGRLAGAAHDFTAPNLIRYDASCLTLNGQDVFLNAASLDGAAIAGAQWRDRLKAIKAAGFNAVAAPAGADPQRLREWLRFANEELGLFTIVAAGAGPLSAAGAAAIGPEQITRAAANAGGTVLVQLSHGAPPGEQYRALLAGGIDVPLFTLGVPQCRDSDDPDLARIFDGLSVAPGMPLAERASQVTALQSAQPDAPTFLAQRGAAASPALELAQALVAMEQGATILDFAWADPACAQAVALNRMLARCGPDLARTFPLAVQAETGNADVALVVRRSRTGATYLFLLNRSTTTPRRGRASLWLEHDGIEFGVDYGLPPLTGKVMRLPAHSTDTSQVEQLLGQ